MFAIAIWDSKKKRLILARDRMGKKPLFYSFTNEFLSFSSELNSLISFPKIKKEIDLTGVDAYLTLQYIPAPLTIYKDIKKLEPASILIFENNKIEIKKYWEMSVENESIKMSLRDIKEELYNLLYESTKLRMISDVPLGAFLSGGIDSSIIVALMAKISDKPVKTFSIGFKEEEFSELSYAREIAKLYSTDHTEFIVEAKMSEILPTLITHYGEPYADSSALPSYYVSRETRKAVTVALNGDGGDENFGGYLRYIATKIAFYFQIIPKWTKELGLLGLRPFGEKTPAPFNILWKARKFLQAASNSSIEDVYLSTICYFRIAEKNNILSLDFQNTVKENLNYAQKYIHSLFANVKHKDIINQLSYVDLNSYLPHCLMTKMDIASMANSLECRSPFLDHKVIEFAASLNGSIKLKGFSRTKWILKETFRDLLPPKIYKRGKMGFGIPLGPWFRGEMKKYWAETCLNEKSLGRGYFKKEEIFRLWDEHQSGKRDYGYKLWALLMLELWHQKFMPDYKL